MLKLMGMYSRCYSLRFFSVNMKPDNVLLRRRLQRDPPEAPPAGPPGAPPTGPPRPRGGGVGSLRSSDFNWQVGWLRQTTYRLKSASHLSQNAADSQRYQIHHERKFTRNQADN